MALVFAAIMPHSPLLVPNIGKEHAEEFAATLAARKELAENFLAASPEAILIVTTTGPSRPDSFIINFSPDYTSNFEQFGDLVTKWPATGYVTLANRLRERLEATFPLTVVTDAGLDYGSAIPLWLLTDICRRPIVPLSITTSLDTAINFGQALQEAILLDKRRIAVIASADLSHRLNKKSPAGYSPKSKKFDQKLIEATKTTDLKGLIELDTQTKETGCEDMPVLGALFGLLTDVGFSPRVLAYESPFGVGHLTLEYQLGAGLSQ